MRPSISAELKRELLQRAHAVVEDIRPVISDKGSGLGRTQWRDLVDMTGQATLVDEVIAAIAYRGGKAGRKGWGAQAEGRTVAQRVISEVKAVTQEIRKEQPESTEGQTLAVLALFFGYIYWEVTALG